MTAPSHVARRTSYVLSLDTATDRPTIALGSSAEPGRDVVIPHRHDLSRDIDAVVRDLLAQRGITGAQLSALVVADGPGSFTGLRIGIAFAKGLARALGIPILSAPSMLGAARAAAPGGGTVVVDYDALRGDVYRAAFRFDKNEVVTLTAPALVRAGQEPDIAGSFHRAGADDSSAAALLALEGLPGGATLVADPMSWEPSYGRPAEAEARRLASK